MIISQNSIVNTQNFAVVEQNVEQKREQKIKQN